MRLYLTATPEKLRHAARFTRTLAHVAYRLGPNGHLMQQNLLQIRGGMMVLGDGNCRTIRDMSRLCRDIWRECGNRNFSGVVADFEQPFRRDLAQLLQELEAILSRNNKALFVPECYAGQVETANVLISTALSGGTLHQRLEEEQQQFGSRLALDLQRLRMSFSLPCPSGQGESLSQEALEALLRERHPTPFYSSDLCAKYFTDTCDGRSRFILFDDSSTLLKKIRIGEKLGISTGFLMYPEVEDLLPQLFSKQ